MRFLITAGGTTEAIDQVREITNQSTGALGCALANLATAQQITVDYVTTKKALLPNETATLTHYFIYNTEELYNQLDTLCQQHQYDAIIHTMAVSDFTPEYHFSEERFLAVLNEKITQTQKPLTAEDFDEVLTAVSEQQAKKISSKSARLMLTLRQTPKIIDELKKWQPQTLLVGFKLLVDVSADELQTVAQNILLRSQSDYIFANDLTQIKDGQHLGMLLNETEILGYATTKQEIASLIITTLTNRLTR